MLLVVLGAGASYDSLRVDVLNSIESPWHERFRPPLAKQLFDDRVSFGEVLDRLPQCAWLVGELRKSISSGAAVEQELELHRDSADDYPPLKRQLLAIQFYLQQVLWECGRKWQLYSHGVTNYADLLLRLDRWRHQATEQISLVTFNYDLLLEDSAAGTLGFTINAIDDYVGIPDLQIFKLHGSVNWGKPVPSPSGQYESNTDDARALVIDNAASLGEGHEYVVRRPDQPLSDSGPIATILIPAIAIPVVTKSDFECPPRHLEMLSSRLENVDRILVVGWRGTELHFLKLLDAIRAKAPAIQIVSASEESCAETMFALAAAGLYDGKMATFAQGFTAFLESEELENFLTTPVNEWSR